MSNVVYVDFEDALNERIRRELGPLRCGGVALSEDNRSVLVDIPEGYALDPRQAIALGNTLIHLGEIAKRESERG
jgi:hypothetical protein